MRGTSSPGSRSTSVVASTPWIPLAASYTFLNLPRTITRDGPLPWVAAPPAPQRPPSPSHVPRHHSDRGVPHVSSQHNAQAHPTPPTVRGRPTEHPQSV